MKSIIAEFKNRGYRIASNGSTQLDGLDKDGNVMMSVIKDGQGILICNKSNSGAKLKFDRLEPTYNEGTWINDNGELKQLSKDESIALKAKHGLK